jgi:cytochrome c553
MGEHYRAAETLRQAIIFGDRDEIFKPSRKLVYLSNVDELPPDWRAPVERMQRSAERLKDSTDMPTAAAAMADVGTSCGWCHERLGGPRVKLGAPPASDGSLHARMKRHAWAVERLWEGLYVPSSEAWSTGLAALSHEPFAANVLHDRGVYARSAADDFEKALTAAPGSDDPSKQAATYARLLTTCATCHLAEP